jgi:hypothetical protein
MVWARRDPTVARLPLFVLCLLRAAFPRVADAAVPSWHKERPLPQAALGPLPQPEGGGARVAITSAGDVAVAWRDGGQGLSVAVRPAGGRFGSPQRLSRSGRWVEALELVADSRGALIVVWVDGECCRVPADKRVWASTRRLGGRFSDRVAVSEPPSDIGASAPPLAVAAGDDGSLTVVWQSEVWSSWEGVTEAVIYAGDRLPGGGFGPPTPVSPPEDRAYGPIVASGPSGETVVLWTSDPCRGFPPCTELLAATRPPGGRFGPPEQVALPDESGSFPRWPAARQVQIASDGTVVAVWREHPLCMYCFGADVRAARRPPGQRFGSPQTLGHWGASGPWLALDAEDRALALWGDANTERDSYGLNPRVFGAEAPPHEAFGGGSPLERGGDALGIASGGGQAIAAWTGNGKVVAAVHRRGGYCPQPISRRQPISRPLGQSEGDIAANPRGDAVAVWADADAVWDSPGRPNSVMVALGPADGSSPVIKRISLRLGHFDAPGLRNIARVAVRPRFRFVLSEAAEVRISVERFAGGRFRPVSSLVRSMPAGKNHVTYSRPGRGLRPGRYRARIGVSDCGGRRSRSPALPFVVNG